MDEQRVRENIALNIRRYRRRKGLSQEQLAEILDMSQQHISTIENAASTPHVLTLIKIAELFEIKVDDLLQ